MNNIEKTIQFVQDLFEQCDTEIMNEGHKEYRLNHTYRVASIGKEIAANEDINEEALVIGCLLHDVGYVAEYKNNEDFINHGRVGAKLAKEFVYSLNIEEKYKEEILYGIATHVDGKSDFEGSQTVLSESISECDNIDRFDKYRLYENLLYSNLRDMSLAEQISYTEKRIDRLHRIKRDYVFKTNTSNKLWNDNLDYQIDYFKRLSSQLNTSDYKKLI